MIALHNLTFSVTFASPLSFREVGSVISDTIFRGRPLNGDYDDPGGKYFPSVSIEIGLCINVALFRGMNGPGTFTLWMSSDTQRLLTEAERSIFSSDLSRQIREMDDESYIYSMSRIDISDYVAEVVRRMTPFHEVYATPQRYAANSLKELGELIRGGGKK